MATRTDAPTSRALVALRVSVMALGLLVLSWGVVAFREPALTPNYDNLVWQKLAGESFGPDQLQKLRTPCGSYDRNDHPRAALLAALVAARDLELALVEGEPEELRRLATCASDATRHLLHQNPASSMGWFLLAWTARLDGTDPGQAARYLDRSVQMAPREVWMAIKRVPLMQVEVLRGRPEFVRGDYRVLAEGEKPALAAVLLRACVLTFPLCEMDWNAGLTTRQTSLVWAEMVRDN